MTIIRIVFRFMANIFLIILIIIGFFSLLSLINDISNKKSVPSIGNYMFLPVLSDSMYPVFYTNDIIVDHKISPELLKKGDIVTAWSGDALVTHRIVDVVKSNNGLLFKTKGDANSVEDNLMIPSDRIVGKYSFRIPFIGLFFNATKNPIGMVTLWLFVIFISVVETLQHTLKRNQYKRYRRYV